MGRADEAKDRAGRLLGQALNRMARASTAGSYVWWRRVSAEARASEEARVHAANLFGQALTRLAQKHTGGCFMLWRRTIQLMNARTLALRLFDKAFSRWARKSSTTAFLWWRRFTAIERDAEAQRLRLLEATQAATDAKHRAAQLLEIVARRWARTCVDGSFEWWHRCMT